MEVLSHIDVDNVRTRYAIDPLLEKLDGKNQLRVCATVHRMASIVLPALVPYSMVTGYANTAVVWAIAHPPDRFSNLNYSCSKKIASAKELC